MKKNEFQYEAATEEKIRQLYAAGKTYRAIQSELGISEMTMFEYVMVIGSKDNAVATRNAAKKVTPHASKPRSCPSCGHRPVATILYGLPAESEAIERKVAAGLMAYGGCGNSTTGPRWKCTQCGQKIHLSRS